VASPLSPSARDRRGCGARPRAQAWTQGNSDRALGGTSPEGMRAMTFLAARTSGRRLTRRSRPAPVRMRRSAGISA
jgi:hypothetical protein